MSTNKIITVSTKGEKSTFTISSSDEHSSLNFFCDACRSEKPIASILHSNEHFWFFKRNGSGFELKKMESPTSFWSYNCGTYHVRPGLEDNDAEFIMPKNGKTYIFRKDLYQDLDGTDGITIGFWDGKHARILARSFVKSGTLMIEFAG